MAEQLTSNPSQTGSPSPAEPARPEELKLQQKQKRTLGLKLVDIGLYDILNNLAVFLISVFATHMTNHGDKYDLPFDLGGVIKRRGDWVTQKIIQYTPLSPKQADDAKMVFFSWADGSIFAFVLKPLEDRRTDIARWLDRKFGTLPDDESIYDAEPKRGWLSLLGGRLATALVVVPTALFMDSVRWKDGKISVTREDSKEVEAEKGPNLNDIAFRKPGMKLGGWVTSKVQLPGKLGQHKELTDDIFRVSLFELFYTMVCTRGLYISSKIIAGFQDKRREAKESARAEAAPPASAFPLRQDRHEPGSAPPSMQRQGWRDSAGRHTRDGERAGTVAGRLEQRDRETAEAVLVP